MKHFGWAVEVLLVAGGLWLMHLSYNPSALTFMSFTGFVLLGMSAVTLLPVAPLSHPDDVFSPRELARLLWARDADAVCYPLLWAAVALAVAALELTLGAA